MGWFVREFFEASPMLLFPIVALLIFLTVFTFITLRVARMKKGEVHDLALLALDGDEPAKEGMSDG